MSNELTALILGQGGALVLALFMYWQEKKRADRAWRLLETYLVPVAHMNTKIARKVTQIVGGQELLGEDDGAR